MSDSLNKKNYIVTVKKQKSVHTVTVLVKTKTFFSLLEIAQALQVTHISLVSFHLITQSDAQIFAPGVLVINSKF